MLRTLVVAALALGLGLVATTPAASAATVSGALGDPADFALTWQMTGADFVLKQGSANEYTGAYAGAGPITLSGAMTITRGSTRSAVSMAANIGTGATWQWPAGALSQDVTATTVTQSYSLTYTPGADDLRRGYISGGASFLVCGGVCASHYASFFLTLTPQTAPPRAKALPLGRTLRTGKRYTVSYWIKDDTGKANAFADLLDAGTPIGHAESKSPLTADGSLLTVNVTPSKTRKGPLVFCVWAQNASGAVSARAPRTSCTWLSLLVSIRRVSNHCGGAGWDAIVAVENYFGNTSSYYDPGTRRRYTVSFTAACDLHDAGYGGHTVRDKLHRTKTQPLGRIIDFRRWSRKEIDRKFLNDMRILCRRRIPRRARTARRRCVEGTVRYRLVRAIGGRFFDADLLTAGIQSTGHRDNS